MDIESMYRNYHDDVYAFVLSLTQSVSLAEDMTSETFLKAIQSIDSFDGKKDIRAWLFAIAKNTLYSWYRRNNKTIPLSDFDVSSPEQSVTQMITDSQAAFSIHEILHAMPQPYKEVFTLRVFGELSFEQIGRLFGKSSGWARVVFFRAKNMIREQLEEKDDE